MRPTALITGAGRGIGRAVVDALSSEAWTAALDIEFPEEDSGADLEIEADVADGGAIAEAIDRIVGERGGIDWVVYAAGIIRDRVSWKMSDAEWNEVIAVNLTGAFGVARAAAMSLRESSRGRLVFISSINGIRGKFGQANYAASKAGLIGLARSLALELARDGVTVNVVAPGYIDTEMTRGIPSQVRESAIAATPIGRMGRPEEIAAVVRFLCSEDAGFMTGAVLPIDGGQLLG